MDPREAIARYVLGALSAADLIALADLWLSRGTFTDSLNELLFMKGSEALLLDVGPVFERACLELNVPRPSRADAAKFLALLLTGRIARGEIDPVEGASFLYSNVHHELHGELTDETYLGDSLGLEGLFAWLREVWDCRDGSSILYYTNLPRDEAELRFRDHIKDEAIKYAAGAA